MNTSKIIKGVVSNGRYTVTAPIVKENYGIYLQIEGVELPETYQVDFSNDEHHGTSVTMIGNADGVRIPRQFIDTGKDIFAFLYWVGEDYGKTVYKFRIPNKLRPDRTNEEPTPEEQSVIDQVIASLNDAVAQTAQDKANADASAQASAESAQASGESALSASNSALSSGEYASNALGYAESASASATASAQSASQSAQIKTDVEDLVDDAQASANASAQSASASANSASQAQGFAQSASASAQSASGYASQAQASANTASAKAQDASTSAQTASAKASEASQSASQALSYKTDAESAKTASQTAQGLAESARDSAVQAKTDVQNIADGIDTRLVDVENDVIKAFPTDTASGSIASFTDGADNLPLKSLVIDINPIQDLSNGDPSPENICPISGWTQVGVNQRGKNLCNPTELDYSYANYVWGYRGQGFLFRKGVTYTLSTSVSVKSIRIVSVDEGTALVAGESVKSVSYTPQSDTLGVVRLWDNTGALTGIGVQIEVGSSATPYEPYTGRSITIVLGQTVYGGKLDVLSGVLRVENKKFISDGSDNWGVYSSFSGYYIGLPDMRKGARQDGISNMLTNSKSSAQGQENAFWLGINNNNVYLIGVYDSMGATLNEFKAYLAEHNLEIVYPLATPIEIQLTPHEVNSLLGVNNIWADSGDTTAEYRADTKLYIQKKIAEAISALS